MMMMVMMSDAVDGARCFSLDGTKNVEGMNLQKKRTKHCQQHEEESNYFKRFLQRVKINPACL